jgi:hypothetical protein
MFIYLRHARFPFPPIAIAWRSVVAHRDQYAGYGRLAPLALRRSTCGLTRRGSTQQRAQPISGFWLTATGAPSAGRPRMTMSCGSSRRSIAHRDPLLRLTVVPRVGAPHSLLTSCGMCHRLQCNSSPTGATASVTISPTVFLPPPSPSIPVSAAALTWVKPEGSYRARRPFSVKLRPCLGRPPQPPTGPCSFLSLLWSPQPRGACVVRRHTHALTAAPTRPHCAARKSPFPTASSSSASHGTASR